MIKGGSDCDGDGRCESNQTDSRRALRGHSSPNSATRGDHRTPKAIIIRDTSNEKCVVKYLADLQWFG